MCEFFYSKEYQRDARIIRYVVNHARNSSGNIAARYIANKVSYYAVKKPKCVTLCENNREKERERARGRGREELLTVMAAITATIRECFACNNHTCKLYVYSAYTMPAAMKYSGCDVISRPPRAPHV